MSVYYVHAPDTGLVKIGFAKDPVSRLCKMQVDSPTALSIIALEDGGKALEAKRHASFAHLRVRGEWFEFGGALAKHIASLPQFEIPKKPRKIAASPLGEWIVSNGHTLETFARVVSSTQPTLSRICDGKQFPRRELMLRIIVATDWEIDANALLNVPPKPRKVEAA